MDKQPVMRLWRASFVHRNGYEAPCKYVEAKTEREANRLARLSSRLLDFPEKWSFRLTPLKTKEELLEL